MKHDKLLATLSRVERDEIESLIEQLQANGARISAADVRMLITMTTDERYQFLQMYHRN